MTFSIIADLPLGTYRGHAPDGRGERIPSVARLHSALLSAAGFGPRARELDGDLGPSDADEAALRWIEENPPDAVSIPALQVNRGAAQAWRDDGTIERNKTTARSRKLSKPADIAVAVEGSFCWSWTAPPPPAVVDALVALCPDVSHLGTTESPVRLRTDDAEPDPTHILDPDAGMFTGRGETLELPAPGRVDELRAAHTAARKRTPSVSQDRATGSDRSEAEPVARFAVRPARYVPTEAGTGEAPWPEVLVLPLDRNIADRDKVRWASAAHRALIATVGDGAPPLLTGAYPEGSTRPVNRIALQLIDPDHRADESGSTASALALLFPRDADEADVVVVLDAVRRLPRFRGPGGAIVRVVDHPRFLAGDRFWPEPLPGTIRLWRTWPAAVPDTRGEGPGWTFAHAALLSLGFVWQDSAHLPRLTSRGAAHRRSLVDAVNGAGAAVIAAAPMRTVRVEDHVHRCTGHTVRPYRATLSVGALGGDRTLQAIGQSRHLGGGLLVPDDRPEGAVLGSLVDDPASTDGER